MTCPQALYNPETQTARSWLGPVVAGTGDSLIIYHGGGNKGYRSFLILYPITGDGVVVMTNAEGGGELRMEVVRAVAQVYGLPHFRPAVRHWGRIILLVSGVALVALSVIVLIVWRVKGGRALRA